MYTLSYGAYPLYDPRTEDLIVRAPSVKLTVGEAGSMSFLIDNDHPNISRLQRMKGIVELQADGAPVFRGRIIKDSIDFSLSHKIEIEGLLACLNDSIIPPFDFPAEFPEVETSSNIIEAFLEWILNTHNAQVTTDQQIHLGTVTVTDPNNYIARSSSDYATTWSVLQDKLVKTLGGYLLTRYEADGTYIDYYEALPLTNTQEVEFSENLLDLTRELDGTEIYTQILPLGADKLTIEEEADGDITPDLVKDGLIIYSRSGRAAYGQITKAVTWDDVTLSYNLKLKAAAELANVGLATPETIKLTAVDLHFSDDQIAAFRVGRNTIVVSVPHGLSTAYPLTELELDILDPGNTQITLGRKELTFSSGVLDVKRDAEEAIEKQQLQLDETQQSVANVSESISTQITEAVQTSREIIFSALEDYVRTGDFTTYQETVTSSLSILSGEITAQIATVTSQIDTVNNDLQQQLTDITKYFRFTANGLFIGESGNEIQLRLDNDIIAFLKSAQAEFWLNPDGAHVKNLFATRVRIGNFEIVGEADGRLSLRKAVN